MDIPTYTAGELPADFEAPGGNQWVRFRKTALTKALRITGPFRVETSETENEPFLCEDGWLAIDARGYPYAIADDEFQKIYEPVLGPHPELQIAVLAFLEDYEADLRAEREGGEPRWASHDEGALALLERLAVGGFEIRQREVPAPEFGPGGGA